MNVFHWKKSVASLRANLEGSSVGAKYSELFQFCLSDQNYIQPNLETDQTVFSAKYNNHHLFILDFSSGKVIYFQFLDRLISFIFPRFHNSLSVCYCIFYENSISHNSLYKTAVKTVSIGH